MTRTSAPNQLHSTIEFGVSRQNEIAESDWADNDYELMLLDAEYPEGLALKSRLQAVGLQVFIGPNAVAEEVLPLIVMHASNRKKPEVQFRLQAARGMFPDALVCFVTGSNSQTVTTSNFNDARSALTAAGVRFVCDVAGTGLTLISSAWRKKLAE